MMYTHTFIIIAQDENDDLESCIKSIMNQSVKSNVLIYTNTPNDFIIDLASKYSIGVIIDDDKLNYNYLINFLNTELVTIVNQKDLYNRNYTKEIINCYNKNKNASIIFTNNYEIKDDVKIKNNMSLFKKRLLMNFLRYSKFQNKKFFKKIVLCFEKCFCTSSVTFIKNNIHENSFPINYNYNNDWVGFINLVKDNNKFVYLAKVLVGNRIIDVDDELKIKEDIDVYKLMWNSKLVNYFYLKKVLKYEGKNK